MALINRPRTKGGNAHSGSSIHQKDNRNKVNTAHSLSAQQPTWKNKACKYFISELKFKLSLFRVSFGVTEQRSTHEAAECKHREKIWMGQMSFLPHEFIWRTGTQYQSLICISKTELSKRCISYFFHSFCLLSVWKHFGISLTLPNVILWLKWNQKLICLPFSMLFRAESDLFFVPAPNCEHFSKRSQIRYQSVGQIGFPVSVWRSEDASVR